MSVWLAFALKKGSPMKYLIPLGFAFFAAFGPFPIFQDLGTGIAKIFVGLFHCLSLPVLCLSLVSALTQLGGENQNLKKIGKLAFFYTLMTTLLAAGVAAFLYVVISPEAASLELFEEGSAFAGVSYGDYLNHLIPKHIFAPFIEGDVVGVLLISGALGYGIPRIQDLKTKETLIRVISGLHELFLVLVQKIIYFMPLAFFGFSVEACLQIKKNGMDIKSLGSYFSVIILANLIQGLVVLPIFLKLQGIHPWKLLKDMMPALGVAFFSKSSTGALPVTIETMEKRAGVSPRVAKLVLPLCTAINMNGCAAFILTTVLYFMEQSGTVLTAGTILLWVLIATVAAIGNAGIPMGCFSLSMSLLTAMGIPVTLLVGLVLPVYSLIDMVETALNVWSDSCVTATIDKKTKEGTLS
jgi:Na+/H+-dicarboxylate symporter